jgi:very-short-patch-repair endonuclease
MSPAPTPSSQLEARTKLTQVYKYLKELNNLRNPVPFDLSGYRDVMVVNSWPAHPCVTVLRERQKEPEEDNVESPTTTDVLVRVKRATLTPCPPPPASLDEWLKTGWKAVDAEAEVLDARNFVDSAGITTTTAFADDELRVEAFQTWSAIRTKWAEAERPAVAALRVFERFHTMWTTMQRDGDNVELILADGMLDLADPPIHHPLLIQYVRLEFNTRIPEFIVVPTMKNTELNRPLLRAIPQSSGEMIAQLDKDLQALGIEPLGGQKAEGFYVSLIQGLFENGEYVSKKESTGPAAHPRLWRDPVLILRSRTAGLSTFLDTIIEDLSHEDTVPPEGLSRIVSVTSASSGSVHPNEFRDKGVAHRAIPDCGGDASDILFSKPFNAEQYQIASRLSQADSVLVQGPPGTGKTHTIANLLGHLLAQGKTVLVTAHTTKALQVLRDKLDICLQPLCLSVLDGETDGQKQLSTAATEICNRLSGTNSATLRREAAALREARRRMLESVEILRRQLRDARFSEVDEIVFGGAGIRPKEAAKRVRAEESLHSWIPGPLEKGVLCPLTAEEIRQLYKTNGQLTTADEAALESAQPAVAMLVHPTDFRSRTTERDKAREISAWNRPELWDVSATERSSAAQLQELHGRVQAASEMLAEEQPWLREVLFAGWTRGDLRDAWVDLLEAVRAMGVEAATAQRVILEYGPELPAECIPREVVALLGEIIAHLESGRSLGMLTKLRHPAWHKLIDVCRVGDGPPVSLDHFRALRTHADIQEKRERFLSRWRRTVESLGGPSLLKDGQHPERSAQGYAAEILKRLEWREHAWEPLVHELQNAGFRWERWLDAHPHYPGDHGELSRLRAACEALPSVVEAHAGIRRADELSNSLSHQRTYLAGFPHSDAAAILIDAQHGWNPEHYEEAYRELLRLDGLREAYNRRGELLAQLRELAPAWADAISNRTDPHGASHSPGDPLPAWQWRQWHRELERRSAVSIPDLQERIEELERQLMQIAAQIIEKATWAAQAERTTLETQRALNGYVKIVAKMGAGYGKRVPHLIEEARKSLTNAKSSVPIWIMTLSRVYDSFDARDKKFDVVIIDESSQSDVTALAALYLGKQHLVVGDDKQRTPDAIGQQVNKVNHLIASNLDGIPNKILYDGETSIYDLWETCSKGLVALKEHFRSVPEIIQFCNVLSYDGAIMPLRESGSSSVAPALVSHRVAGFLDRRKNINYAEAEEIASLLIACMEDEFVSKNESGLPTCFGVISLLGDEQAFLIEKILRQKVPLDILAKHRVMCGNSGQFQGDERDIVFLSVVYGPPADGQLTMLGNGPRDRNKKSYNVAVSRARNQLWVVHSVDPTTHLKSGDLRRRLIEHARDPESLMRMLDEKGRETESEFERLVLQRLAQAGYRVHPQWKAGAYRIDLVVEGVSKRLAVECDGERWHGLETVHADMQRQAILERLGWVFVRIRGSVFFRNPDAAMAPVFAKLEQLGIEPLGFAATKVMDVEGSTVEIDRIRRKAERLRAEWRAAEVATSEADKEEFDDLDVDSSDEAEE